LVEELASADQSDSLAVSAAADQDEELSEQASGQEELRERWSKLHDVHQFFGMLRALKLDRLRAVRMVGQDYAWQIDNEAIPAMLRHAAGQAMPIMCFVGNRGCVQIHSGPVREIKTMGPWLNILDEKFHLHLRLDHIRETWGVRKPIKDGHVTSLEAYGADGKMIIQFFGQRHEGEGERDDWRLLAEGLPRLPQAAVA
jgi:putative hemin transport protein